MTQPPQPFTDEELAAAATVPVTDEILVYAGRIATQALSDFGYLVIKPTLSGLVAPTDRETAFGLTFYRLLAAVRTLSDLRQAYHFQAMSGQTRLILELCIDIDLLSRGDVERAIEKFHGFTRAARFKLAWTTVRFYEDHPDLETVGDAEERRALVTRPGAEAEIEALCRDLWNSPNVPQHWSGLRWSAQVGLVAPSLQRWHAQWHPFHAWLVHGGGAGVGGLSDRTFRSMEVMCREIVRSVVPEAYRIVAVEVHLHRANEHFFPELDRVKNLVETYAAIDAQLQSLGRPSKLTGRVEST